MMFDELHDPDPPQATSRHLAAVAERAAGMRRRRTAAASGLTVIALVAAGSLTVAVGGGSDGDDVQVAGDSPAQATELPLVEDVAPSTTVLDPSELPPAVPVNPDPSELPPAIPVTPDPDDDRNDDGSDGGVDDTGAPVDQPTADESAGSPPADDSQITPDDATQSEGDPDLATSAALRSADPIVAITTADAAVWFPSLETEPLEIARGDGIERVDFLTDGTATVETRNDGPTITTRHLDGTAGPSASIGRAHQVGPDGATICGLDGGDTLVVCGRLDDPGSERSWSFDRPEVVGHDLMWHGTNTVLVIGEFGNAWSISIVDVSTGEVESRPFAGRSEFGDLRFAGSDASGRLAVHDAGTEVLLIGELERFGGADPDGDGTLGTSLEVRRADAPMRSIWLDGTTEIVVAADGRLSVDGDDVPGDYVSARS